MAGNARTGLMPTYPSIASLRVGNIPCQMLQGGAWSVGSVSPQGKRGSTKPLGGMLPFGLGGQTSIYPDGEGAGIGPRNLGNGMVFPTFDRGTLSFGLRQQAPSTCGGAPLAASGWNSASRKPPVGSCKISIVDANGNWVQMMNTIQSGGIPGMADDGVFTMG